MRRPGCFLKHGALGIGKSSVFTYSVYDLSLSASFALFCSILPRERAQRAEAARGAKRLVCTLLNASVAYCFGHDQLANW